MTDSSATNELGIPLIRVASFVVVGCFLGLAVHVGIGDVAGGIITLSTATAAGFCLASNLWAVRCERIPLPPYSAWVLIWAIVSCVCLWLATVEGTLPRHLLWDSPMNSGTLELRSIPDILLTTAALLLARILFRRPRKAPLLGRNVFLGLCLISFWLLAWAGKVASQNYIRLWAGDLSPEVRFLELVDLNNVVWLFALIPLQLAREFSPAATEHLVHGSVWRSTDLRTPLLLLFIPMLVGLLVNRLLVGSFAFLDDLPSYWYGRKFAALALWTATYEEIVYRVVLVIGFDRLLNRPTGNSVPSYEAIILAAVAFAISHLNLGMVTMIAAGLSGVIFGLVIRRTGNIEACILAHALWDTVLVRWN